MTEQADGPVTVHQQEFGGFKRDRRALSKWIKSFSPEVVVMECTGIYCKSPYAALEKVGIAAGVVNACHVKTVPGRKTDVADAQWLATLARAGLLRSSFIPQADIRYLRLIARQHQKLGVMLASEKSRLHKLLADVGIRLNLLVSDIHGQAARAMVKALIAGKPEDLSRSHLFVLTEIMAHIEELEVRMGRFEQDLLQGLSAWQPQLVLLQTSPGIDVIGAATLVVEISTEMDSFGSAERLASWMDTCPGNNESAGKRKSGKTRKGNAWVRRVLCEFA